MIQNTPLIVLCLCLSLASGRASACVGHFALNPDDCGFFGGAAIRLAGLAPPEPVFNLEYPAMAKAVIGEKNGINIKYSRPFFSDNVRLTLKGSNNVQLFQAEFSLEDRDGRLDIPYQPTGTGYDTITLTISGEHKGKTVHESGRMYLRAIAKALEKELQVSER